MSFRISTCAILCALGSLAAAAAQTTPALPPPEAFAALPALSGPALSPDGKRLALIQVRGGLPVVTLWTLDAPTMPPMIIPAQEGFIDSVRWANNHRILVTVNSNAKFYGDNVSPWYRTVSIDPDTQKSVVLFSNLQNERDINYSASHIVDLALNEPDDIYMPLYSGGGYIAGAYADPVNTMFRVNVETGRAVYVERGGAHTTRWFMDGTGKFVAREDLTRKPLIDHILAYTAGGSFREIVQADASNGHDLDARGVSADGKSLMVGRYCSDKMLLGLSKMSLEDGKTTEVYCNKLYDIATTLNDPWTGRVVGVGYTVHAQTDIYFDPKLAEIQTKLDALFPNLSVHAQTWDQARDRVVFSVDGSLAPPTFYLYDNQTGGMRKLGRAYTGLSADDLGPVHIYDYQARDGLEIPAYLTLPPHKPGKNLPVVILPHGGPAGRDSMNFNFEAQFLANRGYAVLQPNFRGSTGYGKKFEEAGYGQWGRKMQDDITDGVKKLIADGIADPKRICIVGGSYGGYAALAGVTLTPDLYACAAAWAPVTDLPHLLATVVHESGSENSWSVSAEQHYIGNMRTDAAALEAASPARNAGKIRVPVLLMHGIADTTVNIDQSEAMDAAMRSAGKKVTFIKLEKETHQMVMASSRARWLTELEKFLKENIGN